MANQLFLELLQVAIGQRRCLSKVLTCNEWDLMHELFKKHVLVGIGLWRYRRCRERNGRQRACAEVDWCGGAD